MLAVSHMLPKYDCQDLIMFRTIVCICLCIDGRCRSCHSVWSQPWRMSATKADWKTMVRPVGASRVLVVGMVVTMALCRSRHYRHTWLVCRPAPT